MLGSTKLSQYQMYQFLLHSPDFLSFQWVCGISVAISICLIVFHESIIYFTVHNFSKSFLVFQAFQRISKATFSSNKPGMISIKLLKIFQLLVMLMDILYLADRFLVELSSKTLLKKINILKGTQCSAFCKR